MDSECQHLIKRSNQSLCVSNFKRTPLLTWWYIYFFTALPCTTKQQSSQQRILSSLPTKNAWTRSHVNMVNIMFHDLTGILNTQCHTTSLSTDDGFFCTTVQHLRLKHKKQRTDDLQGSNAYLHVSCHCSHFLQNKKSIRIVPECYYSLHLSNCHQLIQTLSLWMPYVLTWMEHDVIRNYSNVPVQKNAAAEFEG